MPFVMLKSEYKLSGRWHQLTVTCTSAKYKNYYSDPSTPTFRTFQPPNKSSNSKSSTRGVVATDTILIQPPVTGILSQEISVSEKNNKSAWIQLLGAKATTRHGDDIQGDDKLPRRQPRRRQATKTSCQGGDKPRDDKPRRR